MADHNVNWHFERVKRALNNRNYAPGIHLDHSNGGYKLETGDQSRNLSPRLNSDKMKIWLSAMFETLQLDSDYRTI